MKFTRRRFLKTSALAGAAAAISVSSLRTPIGLLVEADAKPDLTVQSLGEDYVPTTCWIGKQDCGMIARRINGRVVKLEGHPGHPRNRGTLCPKGQAQIMAFYDPYRVKAPLKRANEKGVPGEWTEVSWAEALAIVGGKIKETVAKDKRLLVWQKGRSKAKNFYDKAFVKASGATKLHHGAFCSDAAYRAEEYTIGFHGGLHPDFKHCNYMLSLGWGLTSSGG
ncbi:MAG: molybdopterin-dependent oxidoreductase, partial [Candidatus Bathyarchaeia archaeon]